MQNIKCSIFFADPLLIHGNQINNYFWGLSFFSRENYINNIFLWLILLSRQNYSIFKKNSKFEVQLEPLLEKPWAKDFLVVASTPRSTVDLWPIVQENLEEGFVPDIVVHGVPNENPRPRALSPRLRIAAWCVRRG